jgi:hypothetical protein
MLREWNLIGWMRCGALDLHSIAFFYNLGIDLFNLLYSRICNSILRAVYSQTYASRARAYRKAID